VMFIMLMMITIVAMVVVMNWLFVLLASQRTTQLADTLALSSVAAILDEGLLNDLPADQIDDISEVEDLVFDLRELNNVATSARLRLQDADITIIFGHVADASSPITGANFDTAPPVGTLLNAVRIDVLRDPAGSNPLELMIRSLGAPNAVKVTSAAFGVLDSRVIGYRPTATVASPVIPIAIQSAAWFIDRPANAVNELTVTLLSNGGVGTANGALIAMDTSALFNISPIDGQIQNGITSADLAAEVFGFETTRATQISPGMADTNAIVGTLNALDTLSPLKDDRRVFPIFDTFADPIVLTGFIGARILSAANTNGADPTIELVIEPEFIVHFTAETDPNEAENVYLHKIRLAR
jgi:hypothetical protein